MLKQIQLTNYLGANLGDAHGSRQTLFPTELIWLDHSSGQIEYLQKEADPEIQKDHYCWSAYHANSSM